MSGRELELIRDAFETNWVAPLGPHVDAFEREFSDVVGVPHATALSSGTAALHLALRIVGLQRGEDVVCSTFTFAASANAIAYEGGVPVFIDCDERSWNMDPGLLREELAARAERGKLPRAVVVVDLYGQSADYGPIVRACDEFGVPLIEDAAEALGATYWGSTNDGRETKNVRSAGSFGRMAAFSFNGNKIITTAGGGMLVSHDKSITDKARFLATQARDKAPYYQHTEIGFNYRISNILAAIGRGQLKVLPERIAARRRNFEYYRHALGDLPGIGWIPEAPYGRCTRWLTCLTMGGRETGDKRQRTGNGTPETSPAGPRSSVLGLLQSLEAENIEARPLWKPMHLQPVFKDYRVRGGAVSGRLFESGLCLPSGSSLTDEDLDRVCSAVRRAWPAEIQ
ncbi:MAG TPA: DegT/DnrJ/EryC1/StrS family aminotransferase [bacterium]|nr:DegT/DnrJ/EryC1/StrS family aminotransferase [bacterium]